MRSPTLRELPDPPRGKKGWPWTEESPQLPEVMPGDQPWLKISIVTPSYNQGRFIEETIRSVLLQGYPDFQYIIIDGGSVDGSVDIIKKYAKWLDYWVSEPDRGQSHAINKGFKIASGDIYAWLNSDDYLLKDALRNVAVAYYAAPKAGAWVGGCLRVDMNGKVLWTSWPNRLEVDAVADWLKNNYSQSACFFSKEAWQTCGPLEEDLYYAMDLDLWIKIAKTFSITKVGRLLSADHVHKGAKTQKDKARMYTEIFSVQIRHGYERFAMEYIRQWVNAYVDLQRKLGRISRIPFVRPILPVARICWKVLSYLIIA